MRHSASPTRLAAVAALAMVAPLSGCASFGASGPASHAVNHAGKHDARLRVIDADDAVTRGIIAAQGNDSFARVLGDLPQRHGLISPGDVLEISIWEAPPAVLFSSGVGNDLALGAQTVAHSSTMPVQMVDADGAITVPFAGVIRAVGRTPGELSRDISARLAGKAHDPQTVVRIVDNQGADVTVVGDVVNSRRMPLTTRNERLLDALASAGGVRQPVDKVMIQITRGKTVLARPLGAIIRDPSENVRLAADDVVTALFQPYSFQAMGAFSASAEVNFEGTGITLAQAVARVGGLQDNRANIKGVFIFRLEDPQALLPAQRVGAPLTPEGKVPVIYRVDMSNPSTFFVMQSFPIRNKDILYVSNAPLADLQKFTNLVSQLTFSVAGIVQAVP